MACPSPLFQIEILSLSATFGKNFSRYTKWSLISPLHTIHNLMVKPKEWTSAFKCSVQDSPKDWKSWLPLAELWYNSSFHSSLGCSPFKALYGYEPNLGACSIVTADTTPTMAEIIENRDQHLVALKQRLEEAQNRMKLQANKHRSDLTLSVGDKVLLRLQPYTQSSVVNRPYPKLS